MQPIYSKFPYIFNSAWYFEIQSDPKQYNLFLKHGIQVQQVSRYRTVQSKYFVFYV